MITTIKASELQIGDKIYNDTAKNPSFEWLRVTAISENDDSLHIFTTCYDIMRKKIDEVQVQRQE